jgi:hypothetical protein
MVACLDAPWAWIARRASLTDACLLVVGGSLNGTGDVQLVLHMGANETCDYHFKWGMDGLAVMQCYGRSVLLRG